MTTKGESDWGVEKLLENVDATTPLESCNISPSDSHRSTRAEQENSINSAISHCKKSQLQGSSNNVCSQSLVCGNKETTRLTH
ncbi:hypothetical protein JHK82_053925 [Glycine max]|nr:hypothetical protein JHK86_053775 [Glycine max]KAG4928240.1 hypothetical protein JHK85_054726 [Glycine max]KAG5083759.1 hypothetical protein JHK84_053797 [Glycine max]KAG5086528.1 hypothetical protein JHK82_053925 [Glycine max]